MFSTWKITKESLRSFSMLHSIFGAFCFCSKFSFFHLCSSFAAPSLRDPRYLQMLEGEDLVDSESMALAEAERVGPLGERNTFLCCVLMVQWCLFWDPLW